MLHKILVIEDEPKVANFIKKGLEENGFEITLAFDGLTGKDFGMNAYFDLIIIDINIPKMNGFQVCQHIRSVNTKVPILILTALGTTDDKLCGFDMGADDYLVKPFEFKELLARIRAHIKRSQSNLLSANIYKIANLEINVDAKIVKRQDKFINLTTKEFMLLEYLVRNQGKVVSRAEIAEKIWDITFDTGTNVIDVYVNFLRKKIDKDFTPKLLHTVVGMGYVIKEE